MLKEGEILNKRFRELRKALGFTQSEMGKILGITASGVSDIESGRRKITEQHLIMLSNFKQKPINIDWIRTGKGDMFNPLSPDEEIETFVRNLLEYSDTNNQMYNMVIEAVKAYSALDKTSKKVIDGYIEEVINNIKQNDCTNSKKNAHHCIINAAHDEGATPEQKEAADALMMDDNEWN